MGGMGAPTFKGWEEGEGERENGRPRGLGQWETSWEGKEERVSTTTADIPETKRDITS